jgi:hypothetical protein
MPRRGHVAALALLAAGGLRPALADEGPVLVQCPDPSRIADGLRAALEQHGLLARPGMSVRGVQCTGESCRISFEVRPALPCAGELGPPLALEGPLRAVSQGEFECVLPISDCEPKLATAGTRRDLAEDVRRQCFEPARDLTLESRQCRPQPISDPVAPPPPPTERGGFDLGALLQWGDPARGRTGPAFGVFYDHAAKGMVAGFRLGYFDTAGDKHHTFEPGGRLRLLLGEGPLRFELEGGVAFRWTPSSATTGLAAGGGLFAYWQKFGMGVRYMRTLSPSEPTDTLYVVTERATEIAYPRDREKGPRVGLGLHAIGAGWGFADHLGYMLPGAALELPVLLAGPIAAVAQWDFLWFPGIDGPALTMQTVAGGLQWYNVGELPVDVGAVGGYAVTYGKAPRVAADGPVGDVGVWFWLGDLGPHLGVHWRSGLRPENRELRVVYVSIGGRQIF